MTNLLKALFTAFTIALIVLPVPPTTIIGLAIIANPKTNKYLDQRMLAGMNIAFDGMKVVIRWKLQVIRDLQAVQLRRTRQDVRAQLR